MNDRVLRRYQMFSRVVTFGKDNLADFDPKSTTAAHLSNLAAILQQLDTAKAMQKNGSSTVKSVLLDAMRLDLLNIIRTARAIDQDEPGFADHFDILNSNTQNAILTAADAIINELKKPGVVQRFIANEMPPDFLTQLEEDRKVIDAALESVQSQDANAVASTATINRLIGEGIKEVAYLDAIMHNKYARNPEKLRAWGSASHVERLSRRTKVPASATGAVNAPASPAAKSVLVR